MKKKKAVIRRKQNGTFQKGENCGQRGRTKGSTNRYSANDLRKALEKVEKKKHKKFMAEWIESAWGDSKAMARLAEFLLPKLRSVEGVMANFDSSMDEELAESIQKKLRGRYLK